MTKRRGGLSSENQRHRHDTTCRCRKRDGISRRRFARLALGGVAAVTASCVRLTPELRGRLGRPNIIYAFSDEHRWQSMAHTETPQLHTPNMDKLAREGVAFTNCISNYPVCSPHRAILMTGRWPYQHGVIDNGIPLSANEVTLGKVFRDAGYSTGYIGKWHLGGTRAEPFGFEVSLIWTGTGAHWDKASYYPADNTPVTLKGYNATLMTDQAIQYMQGHREGPFFLMLSWDPPHANFLDAPEAKKALYPDGSLPRRPNVPAALAEAKDSSDPIWNQNTWPFYQGYHAHVSAIDDELGRLMSALEELGLADNTVLIYSSDHGSMMGSHGVGGKRQPYEESIRVPFLIRSPRVIPAGKCVRALMGTVDVMPTLCGLAGLPIPESCVGHDFSPAVFGKEGPNPDSQFIMHISKKGASGGENHPAPLFRGVRTRRFTYALFADRRWCLFDNHLDPYQMNNLIENPAHAALREELHAMLRTWLEAAEDPFGLPS